MDADNISMDEKSATPAAPAKQAEGAAKGSKPAKRGAKREAARAKPPIDRASGRGVKVGQGEKPAKKKKAPSSAVREARIERMMSKAELARRAGLSVLTIDRVEKGLGCRMDTKRKILEALGLSLVDRVRVFGEEE